MSKTGVVLVSHNAERYIEACLRSVLQQGEGFEVVVVDNASKDTTRSLLKKRFPALTLINNEENRGFSVAVNQGIRHCLDGACEEVLLLNPDTRMEAGALKWMRETLWSQVQIGVVQPLLTLMAEPERVNTWGNEDWGLGLVAVGGHGRPVEEVELRPRIIDAASGACMLIKGEIFEQVGFFDEGFFLYFEDSEFSRRVRKAGLELWMEPRARVQHDYVRPWRKGQVRRLFLSWGRYCGIRKPSY